MATGDACPALVPAWQHYGAASRDIPGNLVSYRKHSGVSKNHVCDTVLWSKIGIVILLNLRYNDSYEFPWKVMQMSPIG